MRTILTRPLPSKLFVTAFSKLIKGSFCAKGIVAGVMVNVNKLCQKICLLCVAL